MSVLETFIDKIGNVLTAIAAMGAMVVSYLNFKKISEVHVQINSRMDQLLVATGLKERAEGRAEGRTEGTEQEKKDKQPL